MIRILESRTRGRGAHSEVGGGRERGISRKLGGPGHAVKDI